MRILLVLASITLQCGIYYYLWRRLIHNTAIASPWRRRLSVALIGAGLSVPLTIASRKLSASIGQTLGWPVFFWMAFAGLLFALLLLIDLARLTTWATRYAARRRAPEPVSAERRAFLHRAAGGGAALGALSLAGNGAYQALKTPRITVRPIVLDRLPASMDGFSIAQITDLHIGNTIEESFVRGVVDAVNAAKPDLIVITGDLVDGTVPELAPHAAPLADLSAPHGVFFVTGNHEYYSGVDPWLAHLGELGIRVLRNERVSIGEGESSFDLAGIDDYRAHRYPGHGADLEAALQGRDPDRELIVLAHQPIQVHESAKRGAGLQLSGHTHGGQIWPWHYIAKASQRGLLAGHSWHGQTQLYISRGTGYWGPPVRVFANSEITKIVLRAS